MTYYVIELQTGAEGAALPNAYTNRPDAEEKYHQILQYAAKSTVPKHGAVLMNEDGFIIKSEMYTHETEQAAE